MQSHEYPIQHSWKYYSESQHHLQQTKTPIISIGHEHFNFSINHQIIIILSNNNNNNPSINLTLKITLRHPFQKLIRTKLNSRIRCHSYNINQNTMIKPLYTMFGIYLSHTIKISMINFFCTFTTL